MQSINKQQLIEAIQTIAKCLGKENVIDILIKQAGLYSTVKEVICWVFLDSKTHTKEYQEALKQVHTYYQTMCQEGFVNFN